MFEATMTTGHDPKLSEYTDVIGVGIEFAFQPLVQRSEGNVFGYEALVRGRSGELASSIIANVRPENLVYFDQACRSRAIQDAAALGIRSNLFLNCTQITPGNIDQMLAVTREQADRFGFDRGQVVLEFSSLVRLGNPRELVAVREKANAAGFKILADNFGTGEAGLKRLVISQPEFIKLDREVVNRIHTSRRRQAMVLGMVATCRALNIEVIATGVERIEEVEWLQHNAHINHFQGYYFARPEVQAKPQVASELLKS